MAEGKGQIMGAFHDDLSRGRVGELAAEYWLHGIDYSNGVHGYRVVKICTPDGSLNRTDTGAVWTFVTGNNKNKDYIVTYADGRKESHEIKTDFYSHGVEFNSQYIFVEVDKAAVANVWSVKRNNRICLGEREGAAWYHPAHCANWYHYYMPLRNLNKAGEVINDNTTSKATEEETAAFDRAQNVQDGDALIMALPGDSFLSISGKQLQVWLEKYAHIKFDLSAKQSNETLKIRLPAYELVQEIRNERVNACLVLSCLFHQKGGAADSMPGKYWCTARMISEMINKSQANLTIKQHAREQLHRYNETLKAFGMPWAQFTPQDFVGQTVIAGVTEKQQVFAGRDKDNKYYKELYSPIETTQGFYLFV